MRVMQQIIRQIFYLSCLCIAIFVSILHTSNTENNEVNKEKLFEIGNPIQGTIVLDTYEIPTIFLIIVLCVCVLICINCHRIVSYVIQIFRFCLLFFVNIFFGDNRVNNAPVRDNEPAIDRYERIHERIFRQIAGFLRNRFFRGNRANNAPVRNNELAVVQAVYRDERIDERIFRQIFGFLRNRFNRANNAPVRYNEPVVVYRDDLRIEEFIGKDGGKYNIYLHDELYNYFIATDSVPTTLRDMSVTINQIVSRQLS